VVLIYEIELLLKLAEFWVGLVVTLAETVNKTMSNITTKITSFCVNYQPYQLAGKPPRAATASGSKD